MHPGFPPRVQLWNINRIFYILQEITQIVVTLPRYEAATFWQPPAMYLRS